MYLLRQITMGELCEAIADGALPSQVWMADEGSDRRYYVVVKPDLQAYTREATRKHLGLLAEGFDVLMDVAHSAAPALPVLDATDSDPPCGEARKQPEVEQSAAPPIYDYGCTYLQH